MPVRPSAGVLKKARPNSPGLRKATPDSGRAGSKPSPLRSASKLSNDSGPRNEDGGRRGSKFGLTLPGTPSKANQPARRVSIAEINGQIKFVVDGDEQESSSEGEQDHGAYQRHHLSRNPPSRRRYVDVSQDVCVGEPKTGAEVLHYYRTNQLAERQRKRRQPRPEDDPWLRPREGGRWWIGKQEKQEVLDDDEDIERIELSLETEMTTMSQQAEVKSEVANLKDIHDFSDVRASNYLGHARRPEVPYVPAVYSRYGTTSFAHRTFEQGGFMDQARQSTLGGSKSEVHLPRFSDAGTRAEQKAFAKMLRPPDRRQLTRTSRALF